MDHHENLKHHIKGRLQFKQTDRQKEASDMIFKMAPYEKTGHSQTCCIKWYWNNLTRVVMMG
jgi:hypothetical protein